MRFELFIATRYLRAKRRQAFIGIITGISIAGVAAGVASLVVAMAITNGFRQDLQERLLGSTSHISLQRIADDGIQHWPALMDRLSHQPHVVAAAPAIFEQVLIARGPRARGAVLKGMIPRYERKVGDLLNSVKEGSAAPLDDTGSTGAESKTEPKAADKSVRSTQAESSEASPDAIESPDSLASVQQRVAAMPPIVLGRDMADNLGATVGSVVLVVSPQGELTPFGTVPKYNRFHVVGIFNSGFFDYDSSWAFVRLSDAQKLFGLGDLISVLEFKVDDIYHAPEISRQLEDAAGKGFMATNWEDQNKALFHALRLERLVTFITIGLIVFVAALNILISLIMMVMEKTKDIAVLMSMGTRRGQVRNLFIAQGVLIGAIGTAIGLVLGYAISYAGGHYHVLTLSPEVYSIDYVPFAPRAVDGLWVALFAVLISFIATLYPSWSASRILPAEALRYE
ncbi:MAG TPA: FtsX-like permease family protein [Candidatus Sulfotelmatobacter sp.]|nr:FtsX-like permease family protein [Candidatus Sulfotelmatobacter sp.]